MSLFNPWVIVGFLVWTSVVMGTSYLKGRHDADASQQVANLQAEVAAWKEAKAASDRISARIEDAAEVERAARKEAEDKGEDLLEAARKWESEADAARKEIDEREAADAIEAAAPVAPVPAGCPIPPKPKVIQAKCPPGVYDRDRIKRLRSTFPEGPIRRGQR